LTPSIVLKDFMFGCAVHGQGILILLDQIVDSSWERISQDLTAFVHSVVGDVPVDSEASVVTS
jgi:hypothetical protein